MKSLSLVLIAAGIVIAIAVPMYLQQDFESQQRAVLDSVIAHAGGTRGLPLLEPMAPSLWLPVFAGGAVSAVGLIVLAITLAGRRNPPTA